MNILLAGIYHDYGRLAKKDFSSLKVDVNDLWNDLIKHEYINDLGKISYKYFRGLKQFQLSAKYLGFNNDLKLIFDAKQNELTGGLVHEVGLKQNKCNVEPYYYRTVAANYGLEYMFNDLLERVKGKDLLFITQGELFTAQLLRKVRALGVKTVLSYVDTRDAILPYMLEILPEIDYYFMTSAGAALQHYFKLGKPKLASYYVDPCIPELIEKYKNIGQEKINEVCFIGRYYHFINKERELTIKYLKSRRDVTFYGGAEYDIEVDNDFIKKVLYKVFKLKTRSKEVLGQDYIRAIKQSKIFVGVSNNQYASMYSSDRLSNVVSFGTFYLPWAFPDIEKLFEVGKEIVCFKDLTDLPSKIDYFLNNVEEREAIAKAGQHKMLTQYNTQNVMGMLLDIIKTGKSDRFPWVEIYK